MASRPPSAQRLPPRIESKRAVDIDDLADARRQQLDAIRARGSDRTPNRLVPRMEGEVERAPMDREHAAGTHIAMRAHGVFGAHVDVEPGCAGAVGADLHEAQIERAEALADRTEVIGIAGVAADVEA